MTAPPFCHHRAALCCPLIILRNLESLTNDLNRLSITRQQLHAAQHTPSLIAHHPSLHAHHDCIWPGSKIVLLSYPSACYPANAASTTNFLSLWQPVQPVICAQLHHCDLFICVLLAGGRGRICGTYGPSQKCEKVRESAKKREIACLSLI